MRLTAPLLASLLASAPLAASAQGMDVPGGGQTMPPTTGAGDPVGAAPGEAGAAKPPKQGPYFGMSLGTGKGTLYNGSSSWDIDDTNIYLGQPVTTLNLQFRAGFGAGDFLFGGQLNWTRSFADVNGVAVGMDFMAMDLVGTWWSQEMGLYLRAGVGPAFYNWYVDSNTSDTFSGVEVMLGMGATMGNLGVGIDLFRQSYDANETGFDSVQYLLATLTLDMY